MKKGRYLKKKQKNRGKILAVLASLVLLAGVAVGSTMAFLVAQTEGKENVFTQAKTTAVIDEVIEDGVKKDVKVTNTGDITAYIRATVIISWVDPDDSSMVYAGMPAEGTDYEMTIPVDSQWVKGNDGFWYYTQPIAAGDFTGVLLTDCKPLETANIPDGASLSVEILAQSVQAQGVDESGKKAVVLAWGLDPETLH